MTKNISIAAIDYSMTSPCIAVYTGDLEKEKLTFEDVMFYGHMENPPRPKQNKRDRKNWSTKLLPNVEIEKAAHWEDYVDRFDKLSDWAVSRLRRHNVQVARLEDYAYGARGKSFHIGENVGLLKYKLRYNQIPFQLISPTEVKKYATGKGVASKAKMHLVFKKEHPELELTKIFGSADSPVSDIVDAFFILNSMYEEIKRDLT